MSMRTAHLIPLAAILCLGLSGCGSASSGSFDPTEWITGDFFSNKTPLPGERKAVFPQGVPGVPQGVPKELVKGNQPTLEATATSEAAVEPERPKPAPRPAAKPAPKPRTASAPARPAPTQRAARPAPQEQAASASNRSAGDWTDPYAAPQQRPAQASQPAQNTVPQANWPDPNQANWPPPNPNTFSR
jgi:hypothetical protein